jgi:hypothetical protein
MGRASAAPRFQRLITPPASKIGIRNDRASAPRIFVSFRLQRSYRERHGLQCRPEISVPCSFCFPESSNHLRVSTCAPMARRFVAMAAMRSLYPQLARYESQSSFGIGAIAAKTGFRRSGRRYRLVIGSLQVTPSTFTFLAILRVAASSGSRKFPRPAGSISSSRAGWASSAGPR